MMWGYGYQWSWAGMGFMLLNVLFWFGLVALVIWALSRVFGGRASGGPPYAAPGHYGSPSAMEILRQRYARGEIDAATYDAMRERLSEPGDQGPGTPR